MLNRLTYNKMCILFSAFMLGGLSLSAMWPRKAPLLLNDPPSFTAPAPPDTTVNCPTDVPVAPLIMAVDASDMSFPKNIMAMDSPNANTINPCTGGVITRRWIAVNQDNLADTLTQLITILPDVAPPMPIIPEPNDTVSCEMEDYVAWLDTRRLELATNIEECTGSPADISDDAPATFDGLCGSITVTFTITDDCGNVATWVASYTVVDNQAPVINGLPPNQVFENSIIAINDTISCTDPIPPVPMVTVTDNCTPNLVAAFSESSGQTFDGSCSQYTYVIVRTWTVSDSCGNNTTVVWRIQVQDDEPPVFDDPDDLTISCEDNPNDFNITGFITNVTDNCSMMLDTAFVDTIIDTICNNSYTIQRVWQVRDVCDNTATRIQFIDVRDTQAPTFVVPVDTTIFCDQSTSPLVTGAPTLVADNCDPSPLVESEDVIQGGPCENTYTIRRTWRVTDACGNSTEQLQIINVRDTLAPVFTTPAQNLDLVCDDDFDLITAFNNWLSNRGGAVALDNCTDNADLTWLVFESGTNNPAVLPPAICPAPDSIVRLLSVDFIVEDECGNRDTTTATFRVIDDRAPVLRNCPQDTIIATDPGECTATFVLNPPVIAEECATSFNMEDIAVSAAITSDAAPGQEGEVPVNPVTLRFNLATPPPVNVQGNALLTIELLSVDGEEPTEFFRIIGEDGSVLAQTEPTDAPCGQSITTIMLTPAQINAWALDGEITIVLQPNIPDDQDGRFAVNAICNPTGTVNGRLQFQTKNFTNLIYEYSVNGGPRTLVNPIAPQTVTLPPGENLIFYYATDCAGLSDSCAFTVTVEDREAPVLTCPADISVVLEPGECTAPITLPLPTDATDNCNVGPEYQLTLPANLRDAFLTFALDPNLNEYLAQGKTFIFNNVAANATSDATLTLDLLGDFNSNGAFFQVIGDDGALIGTTNIGVANCNMPGQQTFTIPAATFNAWAADGRVEIRLVPNPISVPPGVAGDGIGPCNPAAVSANGDTDSTSFVLLTLNYNQLTPAFYTTGATITPLTQMTPPEVTPTLNFNAGITEVFYIITDTQGNADTCSYTITVEDRELPVARCQPTTIFINPSGLETETVPAMVINAGSTDNCGIDTMFLTPNTFGCLQAGTNATVTLTVIDFAGNTATCQSLVRIEAEEPQPTANSGICGGDTLFLFANPPAAVGGIIYTYRWNGPNGFFSTQRNPIIPRVNAANAGSYTVEVTGLTGCTAVGSVQVAIEDLPLTPAVLTNRNVCVDEDIVLNSSVAPSGSGVVYRWYRGTAPSGVLIATTNVPSFTIPQPHAPGTNSYYVTIEADGCLSAPSAAAQVTANSIPTAATNTPEITVCEGESITLGTLVSGPGITYQWTGPNNYSSTNQSPPVITSSVPANAGVYQLIVFRNGCPSPPAFTVVNVRPKPATPQLTSNAPVCEGANVTLSTTTTGASVYRWVAPNLQEFLTTTNSFVINNITEAQEGPWRLYVTQSGCNSNLSAPVNVVVNTVPATVASASPPQVCEGNALQLFASPTLNNATYRWTGPNDFMAATQNPMINNVNANRSGTYRVTITTLEGCSNSANVNVSVQPGVRIVAVSNDGQECLAGPTNIRLRATVLPAGNGTYQYRWTGPGFASSDSIAIIPNATGANNGNYQLVVTNSEGCSSQPATTVVNVALPPATPAAPTISPATPPPFCQGKPLTIVVTAYSGSSVIYNWKTPKGTVITEAPALNLTNPGMADNGLYSVSVIVDGCSSRESGAIGVTINPAPQLFATSNSPVCSGDAIMLNTSVIPGATYAWSGPGGFSSSVANPVITPANPTINSGIYRVSAVANGCVSNLDSVQVVVNSRPTAPALTNSGPICISQENAVLRLSVVPGSAVPGAIYTWYNQFGNIVGNTQQLNFDLLNFADYNNGNFLFTATATVNGCPSALSAPTTVVMNTIPAEQAFAGEDDLVCEADEIRFNGRQPSIGGGLWSLVTGNPTGVTIANPGSASSLVAGLRGDSTYAFQWRLSNGACVNYAADTVQLSVIPIEIPYAGADTVVCATDQVLLNAQLPFSGEGRWSQPLAQQTLGVVILEPQNPNTLVTGLESGNRYSFTWTIVSGCGGLFDMVEVLTSDTEPFAGDDIIACNDNRTATLNAARPADGSIGRWTTETPGITFSSVTDPRATVSNLAIGENLFFWTIDNALCGEFSRDSVTVVYKMNPRANDDNVTVPFGKETEFDVLENDIAPAGTLITVIMPPTKGVLENFGDGTFLYTPNVNVVGTDQMTYEICSEGCTCSTATVTFTIGDNAQCDIPSVITPNGDGINDNFVVPCFIDDTNFPNCQVLIFNRWGDEVYRSPIPYRNNWNGTFNGEDLPVGTYFYTVNFGNGEPVKTGFVLIQR
ncbi:MAG TPA: gliding motility-associated C-terminal domain-containing protein [Saprospiraceae bacterium]|nr:gliding motility-associated C-terminal domain-containing protein [Saprospiraceae bacterium]HMP24223.1 gliding motility-associated C-terminal domain-containing protein [Saprospiraceae bacterium]